MLTTLMSIGGLTFSDGGLEESRLVELVLREITMLTGIDGNIGPHISPEYQQRSFRIRGRHGGMQLGRSSDRDAVDGENHIAR